jgi:hypothetical protein
VFLFVTCSPPIKRTGRQLMQKLYIQVAALAYVVQCTSRKHSQVCEKTRPEEHSVVVREACRSLPVVGASTNGARKRSKEGWCLKQSMMSMTSLQSEGRRPRTSWYTMVFSSRFESSRDFFCIAVGSGAQTAYQAVACSTAGQPLTQIYCAGQTIYHVILAACCRTLLS